MKGFFVRILKTVIKVFDDFFPYVVGLCVVVVFVGGYWYFIAPRVQGIRIGSRASLEAKKNQITQFEGYLNSLEIMSRDYSRFTQEKIDTLEKLLPLEEDIPGLFVQVQEIALQNGMMASTITIDPIEPVPPAEVASDPSQAPSDNQPASSEPVLPEGVGQLNIAFTILDGDYDKLKSFLTDLERNIRLFDIYDINFGADASGPYTLNMRTYYLIK